jgi:hypothetical protein
MASVVALSITVAAPYPSAAAAASAPTKGVDIDYVANVDSETQSWIRQHAVAAAAFIKQLGGNTALVAFPLFTASYRSNKIYTGVDPSATAYRTPTTAELGTLITELQSAGLKVNVRPLLDEGTLEPNNWRGSLAPTNRAAWFTTYRAAILPYLELSQKLHVNAFTVQSELQSLNSDPHWTSLIAWAHTHFSGPLVWNPDLVRYEQGVISRPGTITSFDYYPIVNLPSTATVAQLVAGWNSWWPKLTFWLRMVCIQLPGSIRPPGHSIRASRPTGSQPHASSAGSMNLGESCSGI